MTISVLGTSGSNYEIGHSIGKTFSTRIQEAFDNHTGLHQEFLPYHRTETGQARYERLIDLHVTHYPDYMEEIQGMAKGAERSFEELFLMNLRGEYAAYVNTDDEKGCSTGSILTDTHFLFGHNEDGVAVFKDKLYLLKVKPILRPEFAALSYPGFLPGNSAGFNENGICFAINNVHPRKVVEGVGRHFIARSLFEAEHIEDAIARVTPPQRAAGFNYTIASIHERRMVNVEVSCDRHAVREITGVYFHANHYVDLEPIEQTIKPNSAARTNRALEILNRDSELNVQTILDLLSDGKNRQYPLYRTNVAPDDRVTLLSLVFDLDQHMLTLFEKAPSHMQAGTLQVPLL